MYSSPRSSFLLISIYALLAHSASCPNIHIFGARETTVSAGYGSAGALVDMIIADHSGATSEAIDYPACGGQSSCGGVSYSDSANQGTAAVAEAVNDFHSQCPDTQLVLVGYSQGGQIMDNAFCGGGDSGADITNTSVPISSSALTMIKAAIFMGDPRYISGESYDVGTCTAGGFDARSSSFVCPSGSKVQSYCDSEDPYCCDGDDATHHQEYVNIYGTQALAFVNSKLSGATSTTTQAVGDSVVTSAAASTPTPTSDASGDSSTSSGSTDCAALWGQCGGEGWTGATCCSEGTCQSFNTWYSQCLE